MQWKHGHVHGVAWPAARNSAAPNPDCPGALFLLGPAHLRGACSFAQLPA